MFYSTVLRTVLHARQSLYAQHLFLTNRIDKRIDFVDSPTIGTGPNRWTASKSATVTKQNSSRVAIVVPEGKDAELKESCSENISMPIKCLKQSHFDTAKQ